MFAKDRWIYAILSQGTYTSRAIWSTCQDKFSPSLKEHIHNDETFKGVINDGCSITLAAREAGSLSHYSIPRIFSRY